MRARLKRFSALAFRPLAVAVDPRLAGFEDRLTLRMDRLENHVGADAEVATEMVVTHGRRLAAIEERLGRIEERLDQLLAVRSGA